MESGWHLHLNSTSTAAPQQQKQARGEDRPVVGAQHDGLAEALEGVELA
jgi:hypothetical protein